MARKERPLTARQALIVDRLRSGDRLYAVVTDGRVCGTLWVGGGNGPDIASVRRLVKRGAVRVEQYDMAGMEYQFLANA